MWVRHPECVQDATVARAVLWPVSPISSHRQPSLPCDRIGDPGKIESAFPAALDILSVADVHSI